MKKIIVVLVVCFSLMSCSISEQVFFNADGSGKMAYTINMSKMMELTKDLDKKMSKDLMEGTEKDMDSTIAFKDIPAKYKKDGKELSPEQLANIEKMKNCSLRAIVNKAKNEVKYTIYSDFKNISEIENVGSMLLAMQTASGKKSNALGMPATESNSETKFTLDGKKFTRAVIQKPVVEEPEVEYVYEEVAVDSAAAEVIEEEYEGDLKNKEIGEEASDKELESDENADEDLEMSEEEIKKMNEDFKKMGELMEKGIDESAFEFEYSFSKKIKKVSLPKSSYKLSDDKKTIFIKYQMEEFSKKIKNLNLEIEFE